MIMFMILILCYFSFSLFFRGSWINLVWRRINSDYRRFWNILVLPIVPSFSRFSSLFNVWFDIFEAKWFICLLFFLLCYYLLSLFPVKLFRNMIPLNFFFGFQETRLNERVKRLLFSFILGFIIKLNWLGDLKELVFQLFSIQECIIFFYYLAVDVDLIIYHLCKMWVRLVVPDIVWFCRHHTLLLYLLMISLD